MLKNTAWKTAYLFHDVPRSTVLDGPTARRSVSRERRGKPIFADGEAVASPATVQRIGDFLEALHAGDVAPSDLLKDVVESWRADNAAGGKGVFEHAPLPHELADTVAKLLDTANDHAKPSAFGKIIDGLDSGAKVSVARQIAAQMETPPRIGSVVGLLGGHFDDGETASLARTWEGIGSPSHESGSAPRTVSPSGSVALGGLLKQREGIHGRGVEAVEEEARQRFGGSDPSNWLARTSEAPAQRTLEYRPGRDDASWQTGPYDPNEDPARFEQMGSLKGAAAKWIWGWAKKQGKDALIGGGLSVAAEWMVNREKATGWDYTLSFLSGAVSGAAALERDKAKLDAGLAIGTALSGDALSGRDVSILGALGAGLAAYAIARLGQKRAAQAFGRLGRKAGEKFAKEYAGVILKSSLEALGLTVQEWNEFWRGFEDYWREQWEQFIQQDDRDPYF